MDEKKILGLIKFQRLYRFLKYELDKYTKLINIYREIFYDIVSNLYNLNQKSLYTNYTNGYLFILGKLYEIQKLFEKLPNPILIRNLCQTNIDEIALDVNKIFSSLIDVINIIGSSKFNDMLFLLINDNWIDHFTFEEYKLIKTLGNISTPIFGWDSEIHKKNIKVDIKKNENRFGPIRDMVQKDVIENLIENKDNSVTSIIIGEISLPHFLRDLSNMTPTMIDRRKTKDNTFDYTSLLSKFNSSASNIILEPIINPSTLIESKNGANVILKINEKIIVIQVLFNDDLLCVNLKREELNIKLLEIKRHINYEIQSVPKGYKKSFISNLRISDLLIKNKIKIGDNLKKIYSEYLNLKGKNLINLINEFLLANKFRKFDLIEMLLCGHDTDRKLAGLLFDVLKTKDKKGIANEILNSLKYDARDYFENSKERDIDEDILKLTDSELSYESRISYLNVNQEIKSKAVDKLKSFKNNLQGDNKAQSWLDGLLKIPFGIYKENNIMTFKQNFIKKINQNLFSSNEIEKYLENNLVDDDLLVEWDNYTKEKSEYLLNVKKKLDCAVHGHTDAKKQIERLFGQWINGETKGAILGLWGPPGTGKTSLAKKGIANCLVDNNNESRPFAFLPIGGSTNGSTLVGHNYTYVGSTWGRIVDILIDSKCMNPIIFIDEVDKVSQTEHGKEIISILTHLTDSTQNDNFEDKYFAGIPFDLSKALIVFSFNDLGKIDPILRDGITMIETKPFTNEEKLVITKEHLIPEIVKDIGFSNNELIFSNDIIDFIINTYTNEAGVRKLKEKLIDIVRDINLKCIHNNFSLPYHVSEDYVSELFENKPKMRIKMIPKEPTSGLVNGLYATTTGVGGLTVIQVMKYPSDKMLELSLTGQQGDVMKESCEYAKRIAYNLLNEEQQKKILEDTKDKKCFGIHIHTPDAATPKDGPSAGAAMTLAIYSILTGKKVNNEVALTGEIDLCRNVTAIGGVYAKLNGAKKAGVKLALIPKENLEDLEILRKQDISPEDDTFEVKTIASIEQVLEYCLV